MIDVRGRIATVVGSCWLLADMVVVRRRSATTTGLSQRTLVYVVIAIWVYVALWAVLPLVGVNRVRLGA